MFQHRQVIFILGIELPDLRGARARQKPVDTNDRAGPVVDCQHMVKIGVEPVPLQPGVVIYHLAAAAQFAHEHVITQPLGRTQFVVGFGQFNSKGRACVRH